MVGHYLQSIMEIHFSTVYKSLLKELHSKELSYLIELLVVFPIKALGIMQKSRSDTLKLQWGELLSQRVYGLTVLMINQHETVLPVNK